jgi:endonuclease/exonuclease/phosphatase family metal-dependent hydrolase
MNAAEDKPKTSGFVHAKWPWRFFLASFWLSQAAPLHALSLLTYNVGGNGTTDWSTNAPQVQSIGRQLSYLQPDIVTFQEIPFTNTWQMTNFVKAWLPGYFLATNSGTDGFIRSVIASRHAIARSQKWLDGVTLTNFGYSGNFTRDLFEAEINVPGWTAPLHVFTTHLKANSDSDSAQRRAAEASAISNFFVTVFLPANGTRPYLLTGDFNEDVNRPPSSSQQPIQRLANSGTGLRLTTPVNPVTGQDFTRNIRATLTVRFDYILPGGLLFSNMATSQVFRTDVLNPMPPPVLLFDDKTASDHLPVLMAFDNPFNAPFALTSITTTSNLVTLNWETTAGRQYDVEGSSDLQSWTKVATSLYAPSTSFAFSTNVAEIMQFFRVYRAP